MFVSATISQTPAETPKPAPPPLPKIVEVERPLVRIVDPKKLPAPFHSVSSRRVSRVIPQPANAELRVPKGFNVNVFAEGDLVYPRWMALAPNGDVFVADSR
ncbi:MAG TPA: hypothetical protein PKE66_16155, partial [Pyrinomonadaceae bacterium]|nr:hypothetical protein [Pyrinomonadaceae bacterium]